MSAPPDVTRLIWVDLLVTFLFFPNHRPTTKGRHPPGSQEIRGPSTLLTERLVGWLNRFFSARPMLWPRREAAPGTRVAPGRPRLAGRSARRGIQPGLASEGENPAAPGQRHPVACAMRGNGSGCDYRLPRGRGASVSATCLLLLWNSHSDRHFHSLLAVFDTRPALSPRVPQKSFLIGGMIS